MRSRRRFAVVALGIVSVASLAHAVDRTWIAGSGLYGTTTNWSGGVVPGVADRALFHSASNSYTVTFTSSPTVGSVSFINTATLALGGNTFTIGNTGTTSLLIDPATITSVNVISGIVTSSGGMSLSPSGGDANLTVHATATLSLGGSSLVRGAADLTCIGVISAPTLSIGDSTEVPFVNVLAGAMLTAGNTLEVGNLGSGRLTSAGTLAAGNLHIGLNGGVGTFGGSGVATITTGMVIGRTGTGVGVFGTGTLTTGLARIGDFPGAVGTFSLGTGALSARWTASGNVTIGNNGHGTISVLNGSTFSADAGITLGQGADATGFARFSDSTILLNGAIVGSAGVGTLHVVEDAFVQSSGPLTFASAEGSAAHVLVHGRGSQLTAPGQIVQVGVSGDATLEITDGGLLSGASGTIGGSTTAGATVRVAGGGARWDVAGSLSLGGGVGGFGSLTVQEGGNIFVSQDLMVRAASTVTLDGGTLSVRQLINGGTGARFLWNSGTLSVASLNIGSGGFFNNNLVLEHGLALRSTGTITIANSRVLTMRGGVINAGTWRSCPAASCCWTKRRRSLSPAFSRTAESSAATDAF